MTLTIQDCHVLAESPDDHEYAVWDRLSDYSKVAFDI